MDKNKAMRTVRKGSLVLLKALVAEIPEGIVCHGKTAEDLLRIVRNGIWEKYGPDHLAELESEIDLGLEEE